MGNSLGEGYWARRKGMRRRGGGGGFAPPPPEPTPAPKESIETGDELLAEMYDLLEGSVEMTHFVQTPPHGKIRRPYKTPEEREAEERARKSAAKELASRKFPYKG